MTASWFSIIVLCAAVLRVADSLPLEDSSLDSSLDDEAGTINNSNEKSQEPGGGDSSLSRDKRTIGILRQVFPGLSQIVDRKIQMLTRFLFRFIGRLVLRGGGGGGGGATASSDGSGGGRKIQITLPTFPPSEDDEEEDEDSTGASTTEAESSTLPTTTTEASDAENSVAESKISETKVRAKRETENNDDQAADATGDNTNDSDNDLDSSSDDNEGEGSEENPRNKRLLKFNLGGGEGGSGGGSGNFLFDIIRLVAGSGTTQEKDEAENAPLDEGGVAVGIGGGVGVDVGTGKDDGYSAGVPGPLTRLFVIANRGISNLMQDLILRLAQTSERIVNFKARLITSII